MDITLSQFIPVKTLTRPSCKTRTYIIQTCTFTPDKQTLNLANDQLDPQILYFIIRLLESSTCFEQRRAHHQEVKLY